MTIKQPTWLILSHGFNMDGRAASHTITDKIPHLRAAGITPIVISARTGRLDREVEHHQLFPLGPVGLRFDLRHVLRQRWGKDWRYRLTMLLATLLLMPGIVIEKALRPLESQWSWWWPAYRKGLKLIREGRVSVIYSTGGAYAAHVAGYHLKLATGLPWIAEVHDPLIMPGSSPQNAQQRMQADVERMICEKADLPFWFTEQALASARRRHPVLGERGQMIIPGADAPKAHLPPYTPGPKMILGHFGSLSTSRHLAGVIEAMNRLREQASNPPEIELHIYGTDLDSHTAAAIEKYGKQVTVRHFGRLERDPVTGKSGRQQVLEKMRAADVLVLQHGIEPFCEEYIPSKLYEYLWMKRPILGLVYRNPQLSRLLSDLGHPAVAADDVKSQTQVLQELYTQWQQTGLPDREQESPYTTANAVQAILAHTAALNDKQANLS